MALYKVVIETNYTHEGIIEGNSEDEIRESISSIDTNDLAQLVLPADWWGQKSDGVNVIITLKEAQVLSG